MIPGALTDRGHQRILKHGVCWGGGAQWEVFSWGPNSLAVPLGLRGVKTQVSSTQQIAVNLIPHVKNSIAPLTHWRTLLLLYLTTEHSSYCNILRNSVSLWSHCTDLYLFFTKLHNRVSLFRLSPFLSLICVFMDWEYNTFTVVYLSYCTGCWASVVWTLSFWFSSYSQVPLRAPGYKSGPNPFSKYSNSTQREA